MGDFRTAEILGRLQEFKDFAGDEFKQINRRIDALEEKVDKLRYRKLKIAGGATAISALVSIVMKVLEHR